MAPSAKRAAPATNNDEKDVVAAQRLTKKQRSNHQDSGFNTVVTVLAGEKEVAFTIHLKYLIEASDFFRRALAGKWKESKEALVRLPEIDARYFKAFVTWMYGLGNAEPAGLPAECFNDNLVRFESQEQHALGETEVTILDKIARKEFVLEYSAISYAIFIDRLCRLWAHADFLGSVGLQNAVMRCLALRTAQHRGRPLGPAGPYYSVMVHVQTIEFI